MTQRDPEIFPRPNRFVPERWFSSNPDPYQFCAFSSGPRMCLGATLAILEIKLLVATIVRQFRLSLVPDNRIDVRGPMFLSPRNGLPMTVHAAAARPPLVEVRGNVCALVDFPQRNPARH